MKISTLFSRKPTPSPESRVQVCFTSLISKEMISLGEIHLTGNLRIDGRHEGKIRKSPDAKSPVVVYVAPSGFVQGLIDVDVIIIDGHVHGTSKANINLYSQGTVEGHAFYGEEMEISGSFNAKLQKLTDRQRQIVVPMPTSKPLASNVVPIKSV